MYLFVVYTAALQQYLINTEFINLLLRNLISSGQ